MIHIIYERVFNCFHGTSSSNFDLISNQKHFTFERRNDHWLGNGVYFFLDDLQKANWWSSLYLKKMNRIGQSTNIEACSLFVKARTSSDKVLDLNTEKGQTIFLEFTNFLKKNGISIKTKNGDNSEIKVMCTIMDFLARDRKYDASCYQFPNESKPYLFKGLDVYGIMNNKGNQFCIYNQNIIDFSTLTKC